MKRIGVLTSGGDAPGMNAAIRAVVRKCLYHNIQPYGISYGYSGLIEGEINKMNVGDVGDIIHKGGTILQTARSEEFKTPEGQKRALFQIYRHQLDALIVIGGDGSYCGAQALIDQGVPIMGIPATIDNDIAYTDVTIGFDTALNTIVQSIDQIRDTATSHGKISLIEVMGRKSGALALRAGLAVGAESILIPESSMSIEELIGRIKSGISRGKKHALIVVAEGAGSVVDLAKIINTEANLETRVTILGHTQRGGSPTAFDRVLASRLGGYSIELLLNGIMNKAVGMRENRLIHYDFSQEDDNDLEIEELYSLSKEVSN